MTLRRRSNKGSLSPELTLSKEKAEAGTPPVSKAIGADELATTGKTKARARMAKGKKRNGKSAKYNQVLADREAESWLQAQHEAIRLHADYRHEMLQAIEQGSDGMPPAKGVIGI